MKYANLLEVPDRWPKVNTRKWNAKLVPERLALLARSGQYAGTKLLP